MSVLPGIQILVSEHARQVRGRKVALLAHAASVDANLTPAWDLLAGAGAHLVSILTPEHGLWAEAQDMEAVDGTTLRVGETSVPVHSLYGKDEQSLVPSSHQLHDAEVLVIDLADVGARYYTFSATADLAARECLDRGIEVMVADRPNPINGTDVEGGPGIEPSLRSFVGHFDVPHRHGLTLGELVRLGAGCRGRREGLTVMDARGWRRSMDARGCELPWVVPSPNMPTLQTAYVYPGGCLLEGTNLSEGRGTTRPFETLGAPWLDGERLASLVNALDLPGVVLRPLRFRPMFHKHAGRTCSGVFVHVTHRAAFRPLRTYVAILWAARQVAGEPLRWRTDTYEFRDDVCALDLLWGSGRLREVLDSGVDVHTAVSLVDGMQGGFDASGQGLHLY